MTKKHTDPGTESFEKINALFDEDEKSAAGSKTVMSQQRVSTASGAKNPYLVSGLFETIFKTVQITHYRTIVIFLSDYMRPSEIECAIALKDFFNENGISCYILMDPEVARLKSFYPSFEKHFIYSLPSDEYNFIALAIGVESKADLLCKEYYRKAVLTFSVSCGKESTSNFAAKHVNDPNKQCTTALLYPMLKDMAKKNHLVLSKTVLTEFLISMYFALYGSKHIYGSTIDLIKELAEDGADYGEAEYQIGKISETTIECTRLLLNRMHVSNGTAIALIHQSDLKKMEGIPKKDLRHSFDKAVKMFRNLETAKVWIVYIEEDDGAFYTILQTRRNTNYDMRRVAKKNNGIGNEVFCRCIIYEMDLKKVQYDMNAYVKMCNQREEKQLKA